MDTIKQAEKIAKIVFKDRKCKDYRFSNASYCGGIATKLRTLNLYRL